MPKIKILTEQIGGGGAQPGDVLDVTEDRAARWVDSGRAELVKRGRPKKEEGADETGEKKTEE